MKGNKYMGWIIKNKHVGQKPGFRAYQETLLYTNKGPLVFSVFLLQMNAYWHTQALLTNANIHKTVIGLWTEKTWKDHICSVLIKLISSNSSLSQIFLQQTKETEAVCFVLLMLAAVLKATCWSVLSPIGGHEDGVLPLSCALSNIIYTVGNQSRVQESPACPERFINPA